MRSKRFFLAVFSSRHAIAVITIRFAGVTGHGYVPARGAFHGGCTWVRCRDDPADVDGIPGFAWAGQLLFGPLSDRLGRRPVLLGGGIAYIAASFGLTVVSSPELFLSFRVLQACGASACLVSTFATVPDIYSGRGGKQRHLWLARLYACDGSCDSRPTARSAGRRVARMARNLRLARDGNDRRCYRSLATLARDSAAPDGRPTVVAAIDSCETRRLLAVHALLQRGDGQLFRLFLDRPLANDGEARVIAT